MNKPELYNSEIIDDILNSKNINKKQFSKIMNVDENDITEWLSGTYDFNESLINEIENKLNVKL